MNRHGPRIIANSREVKICGSNCFILYRIDENGFNEIPRLKSLGSGISFVCSLICRYVN